MEFVDSQQRYELLSKLGEGGMGVVYEVRDVVRGMRMALKTLRHVNRENISRLKREFRALSELSHPNIINLYELVADRDGWFMTMEIIEGENLLSHVRYECEPVVAEPVGSARKPSGESPGTTSVTRVSGVLHEGEDAPSLSASIGLPTPPATPHPVFEIVDLVRLKATMTQLADALHALHQTGMVHRDLKPSNVAVTANGRVVLMDFGIVAELSRVSDREVLAVGTPHYMAPEQATGSRPRASTDWYAFGVILYEALTGRMPFTGGSMQVIQIKQSRVPLVPSLFAVGIPRPLEELCMALLEIDEGKRPTGREVLSLLGVRRRRRRRHTTLPTSPAPLFVGRTDELQTLRQELTDVVAGDGRSVVISGSSGMGKTSLVSHFVHHHAPTQCSDLLLLTGHCRERENLAYKAFEGIADKLASALAQLPDTRRHPLIPDDMDRVAALFPALERVRPTRAPADARGSAAADPERALAAFQELLLRVSREMSIIMLVEDIQWADQDSLDLLLALSSPPAPVRLLLIATMRMDRVEEPTAGPTHATARFLVQLAAVAHQRRLHLGPLSLEEQRELVADAVNFSEFSGAAQHLDALLWNQPIGHPMLILELMRSAHEGGLASGTQAPSLEDMLRRRVDGLSDRSARTLVDFIALATRPLPLPVFAKACELAQSECERALSVLRVNLLVHNERSIPHPWPVVYHAKIRDVIIARIPTSKRPAMHRKLARALSDWPDAPAEELAEHWLAAGERQRAAWSRFCAARDAVGLSAMERGVALYNSALELLPEPLESREQARMACQALIGMVEAARIISTGDSLFESLNRAHDIATRYAFIAELASVHLLWGNLLFGKGATEGCLEHHQKAAEHAERARSPFLQARALSGLGDAHYMRGALITAQRYYRRSIELGRNYSFDEVVAANLYMYGMTCFFQNQLEPALRACQEAVSTAERLALKRAEILARNGCLAWVRFAMADYKRAGQQAERGLVLSQELGSNRFKPNSLALSARLLARAGRRQEACDRAREGVSLCRENGMRFLGGLALMALALVTDDPEERTSALDEGWHWLQAGALSHNHLWFHRDGVELFWRLRQPDQLRRHADALEEYTRAEPLPWGRFHIERARALARHLEAPGDAQELTELLSQARTIGLLQAAQDLEQAIQELE